MKIIRSTGAIELEQSLITLVGIWSGPGTFAGSSLSGSSWMPWVVAKTRILHWGVNRVIQLRYIR